MTEPDITVARSADNRPDYAKAVDQAVDLVMANRAITHSRELDALVGYDRDAGLTENQKRLRKLHVAEVSIVSNGTEERWRLACKHDGQAFPCAILREADLA